MVFEEAGNQISSEVMNVEGQRMYSSDSVSRTDEALSQHVRDGIGQEILLICRGVPESLIGASGPNTGAVRVTVVAVLVLLAQWCCPWIAAFWGLLSLDSAMRV